MKRARFAIAAAVQLALALAACGKGTAPAPAPGGDAQAQPAHPAGGPADAQAAAAAEVDDGLKAIIAAAAAAVKAFDEAKLKTLAAELRFDEVAWKTTFGDELGRKLYFDYVNGEEMGRESLETFFRNCEIHGKSEIHVLKIVRPEDGAANAYQAAALRAMKAPLALYTVRMVKPGEQLGTTLWSFAIYGGKHRYLGRAFPVMPRPDDVLRAEVPAAEAATFAMLDWNRRLGPPAPDPWAKLGKDAPGLLGAILAEAKGRRVFVVQGKDGALSVRTVDGAYRKTLGKGFDDVAYEPRLDLVWVTAGGALGVIDLREPAVKVVPLIKGRKGSGFIVDWNLGGVEASTELGISAAVRLVWSAEPALDVLDSEADPRAFKLIGSAWLAAQAGRKPSAVTPPFPTAVGGAAPCSGCSRSVPFGASGFLLVPWVFPDIEGKKNFRRQYEHMSPCQLFDPETRQLGQAAGPFGGARRPLADLAWSCKGYTFDATGKAVLRQTAVCDETTCVAIDDGYALGWLAGDVRVELPDD